MNLAIAHFRSGCMRWTVLVSVAIALAPPSVAEAQSSSLPGAPTPILQGRQSAEIPPVTGEGSGPLLTLDEAVQIAARANPQYQSAKLQAVASFEQYRAQHTQYFPTLYTAGLYGELISKIKITIPAGELGTFPSTGPIPGTDTTLTTPRKPFSLVAGYASQPLTGLIGMHYSINSQRAMAVSRSFQAEQIRQQQITQVKRAYLQESDSEAQAASSSASLSAARESARITHARSEQGTALQSQVENADAQVANAESQMQQDRDQVAQNKERLNQALGRDVMTEFTTEKVEDRSSAEDLSDETLREMALRNRPELKSDDAVVEANQLQVKATRARYIPDVSASLIYIGLPNSVKGLPDSFTTVGAQVTWQPWDWGQKSHQIKAQQANVSQSQVQRDQDRNQIVADVNQAARMVRQRRSQVRGAELNAKAMRSTLLETQERVLNSAALLEDLLRAQANDASAQSQLAAAHNNLIDAKAQLQQAIGEVQ